MFKPTKIWGLIVAGKKKETRENKTIRLGKDLLLILEALQPYYGNNNSEIIRTIIKEWFISEKVQNELKFLEPLNQVDLSKMRKNKISDK